MAIRYLKHPLLAAEHWYICVIATCCHLSHNNSHNSSIMLITTSACGQIWAEFNAFFCLILKLWYTRHTDLIIVIFSFPFNLTLSQKVCNLFRTLLAKCKPVLGNLTTSHQSSFFNTGCLYMPVSVSKYYSDLQGSAWNNTTFQLSLNPILHTSLLIHFKWFPSHCSCLRTVPHLH